MVRSVVGRIELRQPGVILGGRVDRLFEIVTDQIGGKGGLVLVLVIVRIRRPGRTVRIAVAAALVGIVPGSRGPFDIGAVGLAVAVLNRFKNGDAVGQGDAIAGGEIEAASAVADRPGGEIEEALHSGAIAGPGGGEAAGVECDLAGQIVEESHFESVDVGGVGDYYFVTDGVGAVGIDRNAGNAFRHRDGGLDNLDIDVCFANHGIVGAAVAVGILQHREAAEVIDDVASLVVENVDHHGVDEHADLLVGSAGGQGGIVDHRAEIDVDPVVVGVGVGVRDPRGWRCKTHRRAGLDPDIADVEDAMGQVEEVINDDGRRGAASKLDGELVSDRLADDQVGDGGIGAESGAGVAFGGGKDRLAEAIERRQLAGDFGGVFVLVIIDPGGRVVEVSVAPALVGIGTVSGFGVEAGPLDIGLVEEARAIGHGSQDGGHCK